MRITDQQVASQRLYQVNSAFERLTNAQRVVSTDRQVNAPSDNPYGTSVALDLQAHVTQNTQFSATASDSLAWLQTTNSAISGVNDALTQVRSIAVQGANETLTSDERQALAANVTQIIQSAIQSANGAYSGRYVLGGFKTGTPPFVASVDPSTGTVNSVAYAGDDGQMQREVSKGVTMQVNVTGRQSMPQAFQALIQIQNDLLAGNASTLGGQDLAAIDKAQASVLVSTTTVASSITRVTALQTTLTAQAGTLKGQLSNIVDADYAQATIDYNAQKTTYQAALTVAGQSLPSLLDFLK